MPRQAWALPRRRPRVRAPRRLLLIVSLVALAASPLLAENAKDFLRAEFWADREPVPGTGDEWPVSPALARARILEEAAWVYSGMVWGFDFSYTPLDRLRGLAERFDLKPIQSLEPGELKLAAGERAGDGEAYYAFVEYRPEAGLVSLMDAYAVDPWKSAQGNGKADMNRGVGARRAAYVDGLREAVRALLQSREPNKPRLAKGRVVFDRAPSLVLREGMYTAVVRARAMIVEVLPYTLY